MVSGQNSVFIISVKMLAIFALLSAIFLQIPEGIQHNMLLGNFHRIEFAWEGFDTSIAAVFFYAGVLMFSEAMFPLKISAIASRYHKPDLPLVWVSISAFLTKWQFCFLASIVFLNKDFTLAGAPHNIALYGVMIYLIIIMLPEIIEG